MRCLPMMTSCEQAPRSCNPSWFLCQCGGAGGDVWCSPSLASRMYTKEALCFLEAWLWDGCLMNTARLEVEDEAVLTGTLLATSDLGYLPDVACPSRQALPVHHRGSRGRHAKVAPRRQRRLSTRPQSVHPDTVVVKHLIGLRFKDATMQKDIELLPFEIVDKSGKPFISAK